MTIITDVDRIALPECPPALGGLATATARAARVAVNEGALIAFDDAIDDQSMQDVAYSLLFAQLAADHDGARTNAPARWLDDFTNTLTVVGWSTRKTMADTRRLDGPVDWTAIAVRQMPADVAPRIEAAVEAANALPADTPAATIWNAAVAAGSAGFVILAAANAADTGPTMHLAAIWFDATPTKTRFLTWDLRYAASLHWLSLELSEDIYAKVRGTIVKKLGDRPDRLIAPVPLGQAR